MTPDILCIGSILWDIIGRTHVPLAIGGDVPGRITRLPGGVANLALPLTPAVGDEWEEDVTHWNLMQFDLPAPPPIP